MAGTQQHCAVLILGASGMLGRRLCAIWRPEGWRLVAVARPGRAMRGALAWEPGCPPPAVQGVKAVVALWGVTPRTGSDLNGNAVLAEAAIDLAAALHAEAVVHCSSAAVYRPAWNPLDEEAAPDPQTPYGRAKLEMEQAIARRRRSGGCRQIVLRIGNVAGADSLFGNLRPGERVVLDDFGHRQGPARSYIAPPDLARVIEALIRDPAAEGIYNVAAPRPTRMADLVRASGARLDWRPAPPGAFPMMWLDTSRLSHHLRLPDDSADAGWLVAAADAGDRA